MVFLTFGVLVFLGIPIAFSLSIASTLGLIMINPALLPTVPLRILMGINSFSLLAIPLFLLAGKIMTHTRIALRLMNLAQALVGFMKGGLAHVNIVTSMFFGGMSGSAVADVSSIGAILIPGMTKKGYEAEFAAAVTSSSSSIGIIIPPSIPMILFGVITGTSVSALFIAGIIPGVLVTVAQMITVYIIARKRNYRTEGKFKWNKLILLFKEALPCMLVPFVIMGGIWFGWFTPSEASVAALLISLFLAIFIYKELPLRDIPKLLYETAIDTTNVGFLIGGATLYAWIISYLKIPRIIGDLIMDAPGGSVTALALIIITLIITGCFITTSATIIMMIPILLPIAEMAGLDPVQFGIITIICIAIGQQTPPVGTALIVSAKIAGTSIERVTMYNWPFIVATSIILILVIIFPNILVIQF